MLGWPLVATHAVYNSSPSVIDPEQQYIIDDKVFLPVQKPETSQSTHVQGWVGLSAWPKLAHIASSPGFTSWRRGYLTII